MTKFSKSPGIGHIYGTKNDHNCGEVYCPVRVDVYYLNVLEPVWLWISGDIYMSTAEWEPLSTLSSFYSQNMQILREKRLS